MDVIKIFSNIKELGHINSKRDELQDFCKLKFNEIIKALHLHILKNDAGYLIDCIFNGFVDSTTACKQKLKIIDIVLQTMRKESTSLTHCGDVISRLCLELPRMPVEELIRWNDDSVQSIVDDSDVNMIWRDVLPECLNVISAQSSIKHCGTEMSGGEYKNQCVHQLCMSRWKERQLVQLAAMFKDMQLSRNDHKQVVNKMCTYMTDIPPESLPPLIHQLLKLCKEYDLEIVLSYLSHYFNLNLYSKLEPPPQDSESTTMDIDDIVQHSHDELSRCLSTCLYHISQGAADPEIIRKHIKQWPKTQLLRSPFLLDLALAVSDKGTEFKSVCLDVIKSAIELRTFDEFRSKESAWVRAVLPPDINVANVLKVLTTESANHREITVRGLINLAFSLLSVYKLKPVAQACWSHGKLILVRLCKLQPNTAQRILSQLSDRLAGDASQRQYSDCLYVLCKLTPIAVEGCELTCLLEVGRAGVHAALRPLLAFSARARDALVMQCRKGLYSRDSQSRCLALHGFLVVLKHIKVSGARCGDGGCGSQYSAHSYLTQLTVDLHATQQGARVTSRVRNEAICLEVISILRRCLVQDAAVKQMLYTRLYDCAHEKYVLHESILELLYEHLSKFLADEDESVPLLWDKCLQLTQVSATLVEPISYLLYTIAQFTQPMDDESDDILDSQSDGSAYLKNKLIVIMDKLCDCDNLLQIDMQDLGISDLTPESKARKIKIQQVLQSYESLIAHKVMQWTPHTSHASPVYNLYRTYTQLLDNTKSSPKGGKKGKLNETKETVRSQRSQTSQKDKGKANKLSNLVRDRAGPFKPLPCVWDLNLCHRLLDLLYSEEVTWSSLEQRNQIRGKRDFHQFALRSICSALQHTTEKEPVATHGLKIASVMYKRTICRFQDICGFDDATALGCLEVFKASLNQLLSSTHSFKVESVLAGITGNTDAPPSLNMSQILGHVHTALGQLEAEGAVEERDVMLKKHTALLVQITNLLLDTPVGACVALNTIISKLEDYVRTSKQDCPALIEPLLNAIYREQREAVLLDQLLDKLLTVLGRIDEEESTAEAEDSSEFPSIDTRSAHSAVIAISAHLHVQYACIEHLINRCKDLDAALSTATHVRQQIIDKELLETLRSVSLQLCGASGAVVRVCAARVPAAARARTLAVATRLYALLTGLLRRLLARPAVVPLIRLDRLLKLSGKKLSSVIDNLITYLEASQENQNASKVLRDTKLIPRLVLEAEQFSRHAILLGNKCKLNFQQYLSLGTARDFRIKAPVLMDVLNAEQENHCEGDDDINDAEILTMSENEASDDESSRKRRKVS